jgi:hypothetical protein
VESLSYGAEFGAGPSDTWSVFAVYRRLQGHGSIVVGDSLAIQKMTNYPRIKGGTVAM